MDQTVLNVILGVVCSVGGWIMNTMWQSLQDLQKADKDLADKVSSIEILVAGNYVKREYLDNIAQRFEAKIDKLIDMISNKADK